ncbi:aldo/keto reductase [Amycolatopsis kentuckyensis]|uniref:aldo/keto reductase n=1 Tax=Amycolatopsis kentuckyensis TaxID=218823 RepID=UPI001ABEEB13|nr:aldo/keto reductase [Amycolatopsis kentuckyensis]
MICLGTMNFGTTLDRADAFRVLDVFTERGGEVVDTANCYASWTGTGDESELAIGAWHRARGARDRIRLATKVGGRPVPGGSLLDWEGLAPHVVRSAVEDSLRRLDTDHVDVCFAHLMDPAVPLEETLGAFEDLVAAGKVREIGLSNQDLDSLRRAGTRVTWLQQRHSYLQPVPGASFAVQQVLTPEMAAYVRETPGLTVQGYSPLLSGAYTRPDREFWPHYHHPGAEARLVALRKVAGDLGVSENQVVLAWMLASTPPVRPVIGVSSEAQLTDCLAAAELVLGEEHLRCLEAA